MTKLDKTNVAHANAVAGAGIAEGQRLRDESVIGHLGGSDWEWVDVGDLDEDRIVAEADDFGARWLRAVDDVHWATHRVELVSRQPIENSASMAAVLRSADDVGSVMIFDRELDREPSWGWPLRVLALPGSLGATTVAKLEASSTPWWFHELVDVLSIESPRLGSNVDFVVVGDGDDVRRLSEVVGLRVNAVIAAGVDPSPEWVNEVRTLARRLRSVAVLLPHLAEPELLAGWLIGLIEHLTHRNPLDVAMGKTTRHGIVITSRFDGPLDAVIDQMRSNYVKIATERGEVSVGTEIDQVQLPEPLRFDLPADYFGAESAGATRVREIREANELGIDLLGDEGARYLQAAITRSDNDDVRAAFKAGDLHELHLWIGSGATGFLRAVTVAGIDYVVDPAELADATAAEIVIWGDGVDFASQVVRIGRSRMSDTATFPIDVAVSAKYLAVNVALVLNGRIVQGGVVRGPVTRGGGRARRAGAREIEFVVGPEVLDLSDVGTDLRAGIVTLIEHGDTLHDMGTVPDDTDSALFERQLQEREVAKLARHLERSITALVEAQSLSKKATWLASPSGARQFASMARTGFAAFRELVRADIGAPERWRTLVESHLVHLAVFGADEGRVAPELFYDRPPPPEGADWCSDFTNALATGNCTLCPPWDPSTPPETNVPVCPAGFWGIRKEIERVAHHIDTTWPTLYTRRRSNLEPIRGLDRIQIGVSDRVDKAKIDRRNPTTVLRETVTTAGLATPPLVRSWEQWQHDIASEHPQVLVLLTHSENSSLELGSSDLFDSLNVWTGLIREPFTDSPAGPIVILAGCETGVTTGLSSFAELFRSFGASVVIGTSGTTLGRFAAPIAAELLAVLNDPAGPPTIGGALVEVRRRTLARGWVTGLLMMAFTDSAYILDR